MKTRPNVDALILRVLIQAVGVCPKTNTLFGDAAVGRQIADTLSRGGEEVDLAVAGTDPDSIVSIAHHRLGLHIGGENRML